MATKIARNKINLKGKTVSIGIDMHKRSWHITALAGGEIVLTVTLSKPNYDAFKKVLLSSKAITCGSSMKLDLEDLTSMTD